MILKAALTRAEQMAEVQGNSCDTWLAKYALHQTLVTG